MSLNKTLLALALGLVLSASCAPVPSAKAAVKSNPGGLVVRTIIDDNRFTPIIKYADYGPGGLTCYTFQNSISCSSR